LISSCHSEANKRLEGKTIQESAREAAITETEFIRRLLIEENLDVGIVGFAMDESNLCKVLSSPYVMIGSDGNAISPEGKLGSGKPHPRYYGTFARVIGKYCREQKCIDLPTAIKKMTSMPAEKLGLHERGLIQMNYYADITIFNPQTIIDRATFTQPHQTAEGIEFVIVNGQIAVNKGNHTGSLSGKVLRHQIA
jgi:N-acyl-D-amino-acid deacylase